MQFANLSTDRRMFAARAGPKIPEVVSAPLLCASGLLRRKLSTVMLKRSSVWISMCSMQRGDASTYYKQISCLRLRFLHGIFVDTLFNEHLAVGITNSEIFGLNALRRA